MARATMGVIVGNRDFFPDALVTEARADVLALFEEMDIEAVIIDDQTTKLGGVETRAEAKACAELFGRHRESIEGVLVVLPNCTWDWSRRRDPSRGGPRAPTIRLDGLAVVCWSAPTQPQRPTPSYRH